MIGNVWPDDGTAFLSILSLSAKAPHPPIAASDAAPIPAFVNSRLETFIRAPSRLFATVLLCVTLAQS
jgi:hypothetical protein